jgi:hypothetical protein
MRRPWWHAGLVVDVKADNGLIRMAFPTNGMSVEQVDAFVAWLRVAAIARPSKLSAQAAWQLSEDIKASWWEQNKSRFGG